MGTRGRYPSIGLGRPDAGAASDRACAGPTALWALGLYLNGLVGLELTFLALWHTWHSCEPKQIPPTYLHSWFIIKVRLRVIPSAFAWVIASSGTYESLWLRISCYSWWLLPPRQLGAAVEVRHVLEIVRGRLRWLWGLLYLPDGEPKGNSSGLLMSLSYLTCG
jgi:hypothetical protein